MENNQNKSTTNKLSADIDSKDDRDKMKPQSTEINIPDAEDIPGQENIAPPSAGEFADQTASSQSKEGDDLFDNELDKAIRNDPESNVSNQEREDLSRAANDMPGDDQGLREAALDDTDEDGTLLNEEGLDRSVSGDDLDVPGSELDDAEERIGEEDEENNDYSLGGDNHPLN